jgi:hypothetical protein
METMDPITMAIMAVLPDLAADTLKDAVKSAYEGLKAVIRRKWGETAPISKAIKAVEEDPTSKAQPGVLAEKIEAVNATNDADVVKALHQLVEAMKETGVGAQATSAIQFNMTDGVIQGVGIAQNVTIGSMTFGAPPKAG